MLQTSDRIDNIYIQSWFQTKGFNVLQTVVNYDRNTIQSI